MQAPDIKEFRVGWLLSGTRETASSRLQGYHIHNWLLENKIHSEVIRNKCASISSAASLGFLSIARRLTPKQFTHVIFEGPEWPCFQLSLIFKMRGGVSLAVRCDKLSGPYDKYFDKTITPTKSLAEALGIINYTVIPDCVEAPITEYKQNYNNMDKINVVWVGHQSYLDYIRTLITSIKEIKEIEDSFEFTLISKGPLADIQWSEDTVIKNILTADIAIIPIPNGEWYTNKSSNRLALLMQLGMPTIATPIPSYLDIGINNRNVLFSETEESFATCLLNLKDPDTRQEIGQSARRDLGDRFSINTIAQSWLDEISNTKPINFTNIKPSLKYKLISTATSLLS